MAFRFGRRREPEAPPPVPEVPAPPSMVARLSAPILAAGNGLWRVLDAIDRAFAALAIPFGVHIRDPLPRFGLMLGLFTFLYVLGSLSMQIVPLLALGFGYLGVLAIGRAWVLNEKERTAIVKKLKDADPDQLPDLRWTALVSALQLFILFPLLFAQLQHHFALYVVEGEPTFWSWLWFSVDKTYLKALPDWSMLYGIHISSIDFDAAWGRHIVLLSRLTVDYILIQGALRLWAIHATIGEAVAAVKADPDMAVRLGRRAIEPLLAKLRDPDKAVRGAAANALTQLGDTCTIQSLLKPE